MDLEKAYYIYDPYLIEYMKNQTIVSFLYVDAKTAYQNFINERKESDYPEQLTASIRIFNRAIRDLFPTLETKHVTRNNANLYVWMLKG